MGTAPAEMSLGVNQPQLLLASAGIHSTGNLGDVEWKALEVSVGWVPSAVQLFAQGLVLCFTLTIQTPLIQQHFHVIDQEISTTI